MNMTKTQKEMDTG